MIRLIWIGGRTSGQERGLQTAAYTPIKPRFFHVNFIFFYLTFFSIFPNAHTYLLIALYFRCYSYGIIIRTINSFSTTMQINILRWIKLQCKVSIINNFFFLSFSISFLVDLLLIRLWPLAHTHTRSHQSQTMLLVTTFSFGLFIAESLHVILCSLIHQAIVEIWLNNIIRHFYWPILLLLGRHSIIAIR